MGTGTAVDKAVKRPSKSGYIPRLFQAFMRSMDGQNTWQELYNGLKDTRKNRYYRTNRKFVDGPEPKIDDIEKMEELNIHELAEQDVNLDEDALIESLVASLFYFELSSSPMYCAGRYRCNGYIRTRCSGEQLTALLTYVRHISADFYCANKSISEFGKSMILQNGALQQPCEVIVNDLCEEFSVDLGGFLGTKRSISGFPSSLAALQHAQGMDDPFGDFRAPQKEFESPRPISKRPRKGPSRPYGSKRQRV